MIFIDANVYIRYLAVPTPPQDHANAQRAAELFDRVDSGDAEVTTSEATLAEVAFVLTSPRHYGTPRSTAADRLKPLLLPRGCRMPAKDVALRALDIWVERPALSFPGALAAAYSLERGYEVATFDMALSRTAGIANYPFD